MSRINVFLAITSLLFLLVVVRSLRQRRINELTAILWIVFSFALVVTAAVLPFWAPKPIVRFFGIKTESSFGTYCGIFFLLVIVFHITEVITKQAVQIRKLTQELALLKNSNEHKGS